MLNPLKARLSQERIEEHWYNILEQYYRETDENALTQLLLEIKRDGIFETTNLLLEVGYSLYSLGIESGEKILNDIGISGNINQKVNAKRTKIRMQNSKKKPEIKSQSFFKLLAFASKELGYQLNSDILLEEWIGILKIIEDGRKNRKI